MSRASVSRSARSFNNTVRQRLELAESPEEYAAISRDISALQDGTARHALTDAQVRTLDNLKRRADRGPSKKRGR